MEPQAPVIKPIPKVELIDIGHDKLLEALFFFWDGFDRASMNFFLIRDTAHQMIENKPLSGSKLTFGIRRMEWNGGQQRIFRAYMEHENVLPKGNHEMLTFKFKDVPVELYIYEENDCLSSFDIIFYNNETFNIPNPIKGFEERYDN